MEHHRREQDSVHCTGTDWAPIELSTHILPPRSYNSLGRKDFASTLLEL